MTIPIISNNGDDTLTARLSGMSIPRVIGGTIGGTTGPYVFAFFATLADDLKRAPLDALTVVQLLQQIELMVFQQVLKQRERVKE